MTWVLTFPLVLSLFVPGFLLPPSNHESASGWIGSRILLSICVNGFVVGLFRFVGIPPAIALAAHLFIIAGVSAWAIHSEIKWQIPETLTWTGWVEFGLAGGFAAMAGYWSLWFPPMLWDSAFYHLPIAEILASDHLLEAYLADAGRHALLLKGASGGNLFPAYLSSFFAVDSQWFRLAPPAVGFAFLCLLADLANRMTTIRGAGVTAILLAVSAPVVLFQMSDYHVDLLMAALLVGALSYSLAYIGRPDDSTDGACLMVVIGICAFGATLVKRSGALAVAIPFGVSAYVWMRPTLNDPPNGRDENDARTLALLGLAPLLAAIAYNLYRLTLPIYPAKTGSTDLGAFYNEFVTRGLPRLLKPGLYEGVGPHIVAAAAAFGTLWSFRFFDHRRRETTLIALTAFLWAVATAVGLWSYNKLVWFNWWMRYLLPGLAFLFAWMSISAFDLLDGQKTRHDERTGATIYLWLRRLVVLLVAGGFLYLTPWTTLYERTLQRFGPVSDSPSASPNSKWSQIYGYGPSYRAWRRARNLAEKTDGNILSADNRIWQMMDPAVVYDTWSVPETHDTTEEVARWLDRHDVTVLVDFKRGSSSFRNTDRNRGTAIRKFLQTKDLEQQSSIGQHRLYLVPPQTSH